MSEQSATPELRRWIIDQARAGHSPEAVLESMLASGWQEEVAIATMEETLRGALQAPSDDPALPPAAAAVPEPSLADAPASVWAHDREVQVLAALTLPRVVLFGGLLSQDECEQMMALARGRLLRSQTVDTDTGGSEVNAARTSEGMFFGRGEQGLISRIEDRLAALTNWPVENGEGLQVLRYQPGAEYKPHHDYFDPALPGTPSILSRGGQRVGTVVIYLNTPERGGATVFPELPFDVMPVQGNAVFFSYDRPHPCTKTLHGGAPVTVGEKWVATKWLRERRFD